MEFDKSSEVPKIHISSIAISTEFFHPLTIAKIPDCLVLH
jgi:hypothetical protein